MKDDKTCRNKRYSGFPGIIESESMLSQSNHHQFNLLSSRKLHNHENFWATKSNAKLYSLLILWFASSLSINLIILISLVLSSLVANYSLTFFQGYLDVLSSFPWCSFKCFLMFSQIFLDALSTFFLIKATQRLIIYEQNVESTSQFFIEN